MSASTDDVTAAGNAALAPVSAAVPDLAPCDRCGARASCGHRLIPHAVQIPFIQSAVYEGLYGGGKGSGKTLALVLIPLYWVGNPRFRGLLLRRERPEAERTLLEVAKGIYPAFGGVWLARRHVWRFPCPACMGRGLTAAVCRHGGAEIEINGCDNEKDTSRYFGAPELSYLGIDQLEHFTRKMYLELISCVRSAAGLPLAIRATANPGGVGHEWLIERFAPWVQQPEGDPWFDENYTGPRVASGTVLWYRTTAGDRGTEVICERDAHEPGCADDRAAKKHKTDEPPCAPGAPCSLHAPRSRQYVHAVVSDNPHVDKEYERGLMLLDPLERARYLAGNWMIVARAGLYFNRETIPRLPAAPALVIVRLRYWDRASTKGDPRAAFTAGVRMAMLSNGLVLIEHVERGQWDPGEVDARICDTADDDPAGTVIIIEADGGQAGKSQSYYDARMLAGREFLLVEPVADKVTRMKPFSSLCRAGGVAVLAGTWNGEYFRELEGCPMGKWDQIDSSSGGLIQLLKLQERHELLRRALAQRARAAAAAGGKRAASPDGGPTSLRRW